MRIDSKQILFGQPVLKIRAVVRYAMSERLSGSKKEMIVEDVSRILDQSRTISKEVFGQLLKEKYLELKNKNSGTASITTLLKQKKAEGLALLMQILLFQG